MQSICWQYGFHTASLFLLSGCSTLSTVFSLFCRLVCISFCFYEFSSVCKMLIMFTQGDVLLNLKHQNIVIMTNTFFSCVNVCLLRRSLSILRSLCRKRLCAGSGATDAHLKHEKLQRQRSDCQPISAISPNSDTYDPFDPAAPSLVSTWGAVVSVISPAESRWGGLCAFCVK